MKWRYRERRKKSVNGHSSQEHGKDLLLIKKCCFALLYGEKRRKKKVWRYAKQKKSGINEE